MTEDCTLIACPVPKNPVQDFANQYSLDGNFAGNDPVTVIINGVPITVPPNTIIVPFPPTAPTSLTVQSCNGPITMSVPPGSTTAQVQQIAQQLANQAAQAQAQCNAPPPPEPPPSFLNQQVTFDSGCTDAAPLTITGTLPAGVTQVGNSVVLRAGMFASNISQADANNIAFSFLTTLMTNLFASMGASCGMAGCSLIDNTNIAVTTATVTLPSVPAAINVSVDDSSVFTPGLAYGFITNPYNGTWFEVTVNNIIDPTTIQINASVQGFFTTGVAIPAGMKIWKVIIQADVTNPPPFSQARVVNLSTFLGQLSLCPACATGPNSPWAGTFPNLFTAPGTVQYYDGTLEGGVDHEVNGSNGSDFSVISLPNTAPAGWVCWVICTGASPTLFAAFKFSGATADGIYYVDLGGQGPWGTGVPCMTNKPLCLQIETF